MPTYIYADATTTFVVRVRILETDWKKANSEEPGSDEVRTSIADEVLEWLNKSGSRLQHLEWSDISFGRVSHSRKVPVPESIIVLSELQRYEKSVAELARSMPKLAKQPENLPQPQPSPLALRNAEVAKVVAWAEAMVTEDVPQAAAELFPEAFGFTPPSSDFDTCGCTPRPITAM